MISRRILAAVALLCAIAPAYAQKTKAVLNTEIGVQFPDNTQFQITPLNLRTVTSDIINSIMPTAPVVSGNVVCFNGTTGLLQDCGTSPSGFISSITGDCTAGSNGVITCTKTNSVVFANSATTDTTNASNIGSGTLNTARLPSPFTSGTASGNTSKFGTVSGSLTNGHCASYDASGNLIDSGSACGNSAMVLLNTLTCPNISTTACGDTVSLTATYSNYLIVIESLVPATNNVTCEIQVHSASGGAGFKATGYLASYLNGNGTTATSGAATTFIPCSIATSVPNASPGVSGEIRIFTPSTAITVPLMGSTNYFGTSAFITPFSGIWNTAAIVDGFQVLFSTGNITSGVIKVYGIQ